MEYFRLTAAPFRKKNWNSIFLNQTQHNKRDIVLEIYAKKVGNKI